MSQFAREDRRGAIDLVSDSDITFEADRDQDGAGDLVFRTGGVERARIDHAGIGTGWGNVLGGSITSLLSWYSVKDVAYGATGNSTADDTASIQAAINACNAAGGGVVYFPRGRYKVTSSLTVYENVTLLGEGGGYRTSVAPVSIIDGGTLSSPIINATVKGVQVVGIAFYGKNASGSIGIQTSDFFGWVIRECFFNNFGDQAVKVTGGAGGRIENSKAQNSLLVRTGRSDYVGVFDISSTDTFVHQVELTSSSSANDTGSGYICALRVNGDNCFISQSILEISETGLYIGAGVASAGCRVVGVRADLNYADGFRVVGIRNDLVGCFSYRSGQAATNTYDGFVVSGTSNQFTACRATSLGTGNKIRYGFNDTSASSGSNHYLGYMTANTGTSETNGITSGTSPYGATT